jgi:hypothetical protein
MFGSCFNFKKKLLSFLFSRVEQADMDRIVPEGAVTCLDKKDLPLFHHSLTTLTCPLEVINKTCMRA